MEQIIIFTTIGLYIAGVLIAYCFIDFYNISDPLREKYSFNNMWNSWYTIIYLFNKSRKDD